MLSNRKAPLPPVDINSTRWQKPFIFPTSKSLDKCKQELQTLANKSSINIKITIISIEDERVQFYMTKGGWMGGGGYLWGTVTQGTEKVMVYGTTTVKIWKEYVIGILVFVYISNFLRRPDYRSELLVFVIVISFISVVTVGIMFVIAFFNQRGLLAKVKDIFS